MLSRLSVHRPVLTTVIFIVILLLGFLSYKELPLDMMPDISMPSITIVTVYPGASAEDVENRVTKKIEEAVATISSVDKIVSNSTEAISSVSVSFVWGTNIDEVVNDVRSKLDFVEKDLPDDANRPMMIKFDTGLMPVLTMGISSKQSSGDLYYIVTDDIADKITRLSGVGMITVVGGKEKQVRVKLSPSKMAHYGISLEAVIGAIKGSNISYPLGKVNVGENEYMLRVPSEYINVEDIAKVPVGNYNGTAVFVKDIADIVFGPNPNPDSYVMIDGKEGMILLIHKQTGSNTVDVVRTVKKYMEEEIKPSLPGDVKVFYIMDSAEFIVNSLKNLSITLMWGFVLVVLVVLLFLREWGSSITIALTIPLSLIIAFIYLYFSGNTINIITLSALSIALGMVVDNAIVVMENIFRIRGTGAGAKWAAEKGANEVAGAITASTLTTIAIFVPILFTSGFVRVMFEPLAFTVSIVLLGSLFVALSLTPMLSTLLWKKGKEEKKENKEGFFHKLLLEYEEILKWSINNPKKTLLISIIIFALSIPIFIMTDKAFMPDTDTSQMIGVMEMSPGTSMDETKEVALQLHNIIKKEVPEIEIEGVSIGSMGGFASFVGLREGSNVALVRAKLVPMGKRDKSSKDVSIDIINRMQHLPGVEKASFMSTDAVMTSMGSSAPISIEIYGYDLTKMKAIADTIKARMDRDGLFINTTVSLEDGAKEIWLKPKYGLTYSYGIIPYNIAFYGRTMFAGANAGVFRNKGQEYDIVVSMDPESLKTLEDIEEISVPAMGGKVRMPLRSITNMEEHSGPVSIQRIDKERVVKVESDIIGALSKGEKRLNEILAKVNLPEDMHIKQGGSIKDQKESFSDLFLAFIFGIVLVYLVMAAQFESFRDPMIIMFSVPFAFTGVAILTFIAGLEFSVMSYVGLIMLVGIVVNNAIVLVDATIKLRRDEENTLQASIIEAGKRRFRPVLMTATTTLFGILPMTIMNVEGADMWKPLGFAIVGGIVVSTLITLVLVPTMYYLFHKGKEINKA